MTSSCSKSIFAVRVKELRKGMGLTQEEFSSGLDTAQQTCANWEQGRTIPDIPTLWKICEYGHCDIGFLLGEFDTKTKVAADIVEATGLSEDAVLQIQKYIKGHEKLAETFSEIIASTNFLDAVAQVQTAKELNGKVAKEIAENPEVEQLYKSLNGLGNPRGTERVALYKWRAAESFNRAVDKCIDAPDK